MSPVRWDPLSGTPLLVAPIRTSRPHDTVPHPSGAPAPPCPFCPGAESQTPPEVWADRPDGSPADGPGWRVRAVPNLYPVLPRDEGVHEVIVNAPRHVVALGELTHDELAAAIDGWAVREAAVRADLRGLTAFLFVNQGAAAGASLQHSHAQVIGFPFVPPALAARRQVFSASARCPICDELGDPGLARIATSGPLVAWCPDAPPLSGAVRIAPAVHTPAWPAAPGNDLARLVGPLMRALAVVVGTDATNCWLHRSGVDDSAFHWHFEIVPRRGMLAGMELGAGVLSLFSDPQALADAVRAALVDAPD
jgi:UDPglucose--hexose-1-phosphate uridylyltransferase